jgi:hypothetical protein
VVVDTSSGPAESLVQALELVGRPVRAA